ncbi:MAG: hypothetical protein U0586_16510 [Candidatus Brocadiaceae bacterium]
MEEEKRDRAQQNQLNTEKQNKLPTLMKARKIRNGAEVKLHLLPDLLECHIDCSLLTLTLINTWCSKAATNSSL